jgi:hypothetical protein
VPQLYTLTGQRDNRLNLQIAQASRAANDLSIQIARAAKRDSTAMRIIAAVTLLFLPGTFIAVGFGFNIFIPHAVLPGCDIFFPPHLSKCRRNFAQRASLSSSHQSVFDLLSSLFSFLISLSAIPRCYNHFFLPVFFLLLPSFSSIGSAWTREDQVRLAGEKFLKFQK